MNRGSKILTVFNFIIAVLSVAVEVFYVSLFSGFIDAKNADPSMGTGIAAGFSLVFMIIAFAAILVLALVGIILFCVAKFSGGRLQPLMPVRFISFHIFISVGSAVLLFLAVSY